MKKFAKWGGIGLAVLILIVVGGLALAPRFVDLDFVKQRAAEAVAEATGRPLRIDGPVSLSLLPSPVLKIGRLALPNIEGGRPEPMLSVEAVEARLAWLPLLTGTVHVAELHLLRPALHLEVTKDGRANWELPPGRGGASPAPEAAGPTVRLDRITIEDGHLDYLDAVRGIAETVAIAGAEARTPDLMRGPYHLQGRLGYRGETLELSADMAERAPGRPPAITANVGGSDFKLALKGALALPPEVGTSVLTLKGEGKNLARLLALARIDGLPPALAQGFGIETELKQSGAELSLAPLRLRLGPSTAEGRLDLGLGELTSVALKLNASALPLDRFIVPAKAAPAKGGGFAWPERLALRLPTDLRGKVNLNLAGLTWAGERIGDATLKASLDKGRLEVETLSASLPGEGRLALAGELATPDGAPAFKGTLEAEVGAPRRLLAWLKAPLPPARADRLAHSSLSAAFAGDAQGVALSDIVARLDATTARGSVRLALGARPSLAIDAALDRIDLDGYLPPAAAGGGGKAAPQALADGLRALATPPPIGALAVALHLGFDDVVYNGQSLKRGRLAAAYENGAARIETLSVGDLAGGKLEARGALLGIGAAPRFQLSYALAAREAGGLITLIDPEIARREKSWGRLALKGSAEGDAERLALDQTAQVAGAEAALKGTVGLARGAPVDVSLSLASKDPARLLRLAGLAPPKGLGRLQLRLKAQGNAEKAAVDGEVEIAGGRLGVSGDVAKLASEPEYDLAFEVAQPRLHALLATLLPDYKPAAGAALGALRAKGRAKGDARRLTLSGLSVSLGEMRLEAEAKIDAVARTAELKLDAGLIDLDKLLPAPTAKPAGASPTAVPDLAESLPGGRTVRLDLKIDTLVWRGERVRQAVARLTLADGALSIEQLSAALPGESRLALEAKPATKAPGFAGRIELTSAKPHMLLRWLDLGAGLPEDRPRRLHLAGALSATAGRLKLSGFEAKLDDGTARGSIEIAWQARPRVDLKLDLDRLDLDAYLPTSAAVAKPAADGTDVPAMLHALAPLAAFDGSAVLTAGEIRLRGQKIGGLSLALKLADGNLSLDRLEIAELAGARLSAKGGIKDLRQRAAFHIEHELQAEDATGLARLAGLTPAADGGALGAVSIKGRASGDADGLSLDEHASLAGAKLALKAELGLAPGAPVDAEARIELADPARIARLLGRSLPARAGRAVLEVKAKGSAEGAKVNAKLSSAAAEATLDGRATLAGATGFDGKLDLSLKDSGPLLALVGLELKRSARSYLNTVRLAGKLVVNKTRAVLSDLSGGAGGSKITGGQLTLPFAAGGGYKVALQLGKLELDPLLAAFGAEAKDGAPPRRSAEPGFALPDKLRAGLDLKVGRLTWQGRELRDVAVLAELAGGTLQLTRVATALPGEGQARFAGTLTAVQGEPALDGRIAADVKKLRALLEWAGMTPPRAAKERLRQADLAAALSYRPGRLGLDGLSLGLDQSRLGGRLEASFAPRLRLSADLTLDQVALDAYLPAPAEDGTPPPAAAATGPLAGLAALDADLRLAVGRLDYGGQRLKEARLHAVLRDGALRLEQLSVGDLAGARLAVQGEVRDLAGRPAFDLRYQAETADIGPAFAAVGATSPLPPAEIGAVTIQGSVAGTTDKISLDAKAAALQAALELVGDVGLADGHTLKLTATLTAERPDRLLRLAGLTPTAAPGPLNARLSANGTAARTTLDGRADLLGGSFTLNGEVSGLDGKPGYALKLEARHPDLHELRRRLGIETGNTHPPPFGPLLLTGEVAGDDERLALKALDIRLDPSRVTGQAELSFTGARPRLTGALSSELIDLRRLSEGSGGGRSAPAGAGDRDKVFSRAPLPIDRLRSIDAVFDLQVRRLLLPRLALNDLTTTIRLDDGHLSVKPIAAEVGGGRLRGEFQVEPRNARTALVTAVLGVDKLDLRSMARDLGTKEVLEGKLDGNLDVRGHGGSVAEVMAHLDGKSSLVVGRGRIDSKYIDLIGADLADNPLQFLNPGGAGYTELNCLVSRFEARDGLADSRAMVLDTKRMTVVGEGRINLRTEGLDLSIQPTPKSGVDTGLAGRLGLSLGELARPFKLGGTLAHPRAEFNVAGALFTLGKAAGGIALLGPAGIAAALLTDSGAENPCLAAIEAARHGVAPPAQETARPQTTRQPSARKSKAPLKRTLDNLEGTLKGLLNR